MARREKFKKGDLVAFRRSSGEIAYGEISHVHELDGDVTVTWCDKMLYKTIRMEDVSHSAYPLAVGARRSTGRKAARRTGRKGAARRTGGG